jgi:hypothetical protein
MAAGNQPTAATINALAGQKAIGLRDAVYEAIRFNAYLTALGGQTFLVGLGMSSGDAAAMVAAYGNMASWAAVFPGGAYNGPALPFNFESNSTPLWGGQ